MSTKSHQSRPFLSHLLPPIPRHDYLARRRWFRKLSTTLMIVVLSILVAAFIVYTSNPSSFGWATR
jgi:hypothetical protein